jgi:polygalacturonase
MHFSSLIAAAAIGGSVMVSAAPAATPIDKRATSCTFSGSSGAASATKSKAACATIVLNNVAVPAGTTLDLTGLTTGTHVIFEGTTTFGYKEWAGPLVSVSGTSITVTGAAGSVLDGSGQLYWDGQGSNGGKTKPKFFYAHSLTSSSINGLTIKNSPVQIFSINGAKQLTMDKITIDNSAGDAKNGVEVGHNTDAFDIGSSTGVTITGAVVHNQDDCVAVNSGSKS